MNNFKVYFYIYCIIILIRAVFNFSQPTMLMYALLTTADVIAAVGLFGFCFHKRIIARWFWLAFIVPFLVAQGFVIVNSAQGNLLTGLIGTILVLPVPYGLFLYGYKTDWSTLSAKKL